MPPSASSSKGTGANRVGLHGEDEDDDDDEGFLQDLLGKQKLKQGAQVAQQHGGGGAGGGGAKDKKNAASGGGSFQSLGLPPTLLKALLQRGFTTPTPIQRAALPAALSTPSRDIVGMARTGSGKTLAYIIPLLTKLGGIHSPKFGARALVLVPTRELALQVLKVGKDLARGFSGKGGPGGHRDDASEGSSGSQPLRWGLVVGGDSLEEQYAMMASNPDVIIATPGRLLHLLVEMSTDLRAVEYVVFDEADRLFELGFSVALSEILSKLAPTRQTLLFSATLPKSLVEFAKAGLQNPKLIRLDSESKISNDLQMAFLSVKPKEKEAALLILLRDVIGVPTHTGPDADGNGDWLDEDDNRHKKRKRFDGGGKEDKKGKKTAKQDPSQELLPHQTIIFAATKHHVEYLSLLLSSAGYSVSAIYGSLDQSARRIQLNNFRFGKTNLLVVTDLAARGIDIPILSNVVNYDFPISGAASSRTFVHRVGRTARAGRKGWAYSFITNSELAYLFDLQLFLGRPLLVSPVSASSSSSSSSSSAAYNTAGDLDYSANLILGTLPRDLLDLESDHFRSVLLEPNSTLVALLGVAEKGQKMYERSSVKTSKESYRRAKELVTDDTTCGLAGNMREEEGIHPIFHTLGLTNVASSNGSPTSSKSPVKKSSAPSAAGAVTREDLLAKVNSFRPETTIFELGNKGNKTPGAQIMQKRRITMGKGQVAKSKASEQQQSSQATDVDVGPDAGDANGNSDGPQDVEDEVFDGFSAADGAKKEDDADEEDLAAVFDMPKPKKHKQSQPKEKKDFRDASVYMGYVQEGADAERGYSLSEGGNNFASQAASASYDLTAATDENSSHSAAQKASMLRWDRKHKKFVRGDGTGSDNKKLIRTESGAKLPASFKSGTFDEWKKKQKVYLPKVGEMELKDRQLPSSGFGGGRGGKRFRHNATAAPAMPNRKPRKDGKGGVVKDDYKKKAGKGGAAGGDGDGAGGGGSKTRSSTSKNLMGGKRASSQLKSIDQIRKERAQKAKRVARSNQPSKKKKKQ